jgi:hypothetical protein
MTFATKNCLITLDKLHKMLVPNVNEVHYQQIFHHLYITICHLYITIKISNLNNDMWQMKKVWFLFFLKPL